MEETRPRGGRRVPDPPGRAETRRATSPYGTRRPPSSGRVGESGRLGVQPESGDRSHPRPSTGGTPIANKYGDGKVKRTSKGGLKALEIVEGEADRTEETPPPPRGARRRGRRRGTRVAPNGGSPPWGETPRRGPPGARAGPEVEGIRHAGRRARPAPDRPVPARGGEGGRVRRRASPGSRRRRRDGPVRPVSKHGPRSLTRARARGREAPPRS